MEITNDHLKIFEDYFVAYLKKFGLTDWDIAYKVCDDIDPQGQISIYSDCRNALVEINKTLGCNESQINDRLRFLACHEACHLMLSDIIHIALSKSITRTAFDMTKESIAMRLTNLLMEVI
jgi:hypothetical protein